MGNGEKFMVENVYKSDGRFYKLVEALVFLIIINVAYVLSFFIRFQERYDPVYIQSFYRIVPYLSLTAVIVFSVYGIFSMVKKPLIERMLTITLALVIINVSAIALVFFTRGFDFPRSVFFIAFILQWISINIVKHLIIMWIRSRKPRNIIMVVGNEEDCSNIVQRILTNGEHKDQIRYVVSSECSKILDYITEVDRVYIGSEASNDIKNRIISACLGQSKTVYLVPNSFEIAMMNSQVVQLDDILAFKVDNLYLSFEKRVLKRSLDICVSLVGILLTAPFMIFTAIAVKAYDGGNVLFAQERVTIGNKKFKVYKFRSMIVDAEKHTGAVLAQAKDPRVTPIGRFIRATRLDELPQLFNVLNGDMSLVGPRPERPVFIDEFVKKIPDFKYRVAVKAGVTGLAQVMGKYTTTPMNKIKYDLLYIRNAGILYDIKIMMQTVKVLFMKSSSAGTTEEKSIDELHRELGIEVKRSDDAIEYIYLNN